MILTFNDKCDFNYYFYSNNDSVNNLYKGIERFNIYIEWIKEEVPDLVCDNEEEQKRIDLMEIDRLKSYFKNCSVFPHIHTNEIYLPDILFMKFIFGESIFRNDNNKVIKQAIISYFENIQRYLNNMHINNLFDSYKEILDKQFLLIETIQ